MDQRDHSEIKNLVLAHVKNMFEEMEQELALSHQEKYALLEDAFENAADNNELRIAFEQWYADHANEIQFEHEVDELWEQAVAVVEE